MSMSFIAASLPTHRPFASSRPVSFSASLLVLITAGVLGLASAQAQTTSPTSPPAPAGASTPGPHAEHPRAAHPGHGEHRKAAERFHEQRFKALDTDGDGHLSRAEFEAEHERMRARRMAAFDAADADRDGRLSPTEMRSFHRAMRKDMHESMRSAPR